MTQDELQSFGLDAEQVAQVRQWHRDECGMAVARLMDYLLRGKRDKVRVRLLGVAFAFGLENLHGYATQANAAAVEGVTQQAIADAAKCALQALQGRPSPGKESTKGGL